MTAERYAALSRTPSLAAAGVFLLAYATPVVWEGAPRWLTAACSVAVAVVWTAFALDLAVRTSLHRGDRRRYLLQHPLDVAAVLLPALRPLHLLRALTAAQLLTSGGRLLQRSRAIVLSAALVVLVAAVAELDAEQSAPGATITDFGDALWWAVSTVTTVGYGDVYPVTAAGRWVAAGLMVVGVAVVGALTATVAAWFVSQRDEGRSPAGTGSGPRAS